MGAELGLRHGPPLLRDVVLLHEPGPRAAGHLEELEGEQGLQERRVLAAEGVGREGCQLASAGFGCPAYEAQQGAGRLHRREGGGPLQGRYLPLLSDLEPCTAFLTSYACIVTHTCAIVASCYCCSGMLATQLASSTQHGSCGSPDADR